MEGSEEEAMRARPVYVAAVDLSCKFQIMPVWVLIDGGGGGGCEFQLGEGVFGYSMLIVDLGLGVLVELVVFCGL